VSEPAYARVLPLCWSVPPVRADASSRAPDEDLPLVRRAASGDRQAFDELYRLRVDAVHRQLSRLVGPDPEREDLVQLVFLEAFRGLPTFRGDATFSTWLYRIVVNAAYEHLRRRRRRARPITPEDLDLAGPARSREEWAGERQQLARLLGLLDRIKPKKRIAFVLRVVEGLSLDEIARLVGARPPAVAQRVRHAQRELLAMIEREELRLGRERR
jgi:RNA polymerase sigma-70 factor (ECF subfamily)